MQLIFLISPFPSATGATLWLVMTVKASCHSILSTYAMSRIPRWTLTQISHWRCYITYKISLLRAVTAVSLGMVMSALKGLCELLRRSTRARPRPRTLMTTSQLGGSLRQSPQSSRPGDSASTTEAAKYILFITTRKAELLNLNFLQTGSKIWINKCSCPSPFSFDRLFSVFNLLK